jgi:delta1-piperideine-2-carboxylate reductase
MQNITLTITECNDLARNSLLKRGANEENAQAVADIMTIAERDGCASHGLFRLPGYLSSLTSRKVDGKAKPTVEATSPGVVRVDGKGGFAPLALQTAYGPLAEAAKKNGIAACAINNIYHFAALWPEATEMAERGCVSMAFTAATPMVAPAGGIKPFFGTNPMAFGWPRKGRPPMVFDQASAAMARGEIMIAARDGHAVPETAGVDVNGLPTTDPNAILKGAQTAFGGYKGAAIALMVELLVGPMIGDLCSFESGEIDNRDGGPPRGGELIIAMDPARFGDPDGFEDHAEAMFAELLQQPGTRLPADRRYRNRTRVAEEGFSIPQSLYDSILEKAG